MQAANIAEWLPATTREIRDIPKKAESAVDSKPLARRISFQVALETLENLYAHTVITTTADKAQNYYCLIPKTWYTRLVTTELQTDDYNKIPGNSLQTLVTQIAEYQYQCLNDEYILISQVELPDPEDPNNQRMLKNKTKMPVRYLTAKLRKNPVTTRGIASWFRVVTSGIAKVVKHVPHRNTPSRTRTLERKMSGNPIASRGELDHQRYSKCH